MIGLLFSRRYISLLDSEYMQSLRTMNLQIEGMQFEQDDGIETNTRAMVLTLKTKKKEDHYDLLGKIKELSGVIHLEAL